MSHHSRLPYGTCGIGGNREAYRIWFRRNAELPESPQFGMLALLVLDDDADKAGVLCAEIWRVAARLLRPRELIVMRLRFQEDHTLEEAGDALGVTRARIAQIEVSALRKLRGALK